MGESRTTRVLGAADIAAVVHRHGRDRVLDELIQRLRDALLTHDCREVISPVRRGFDYVRPAPGLLEWMPVMETGRVVAIKTVGYHPRNPTVSALPSVLATTSLYDTATGRLQALLDATLLTALRTGAASAIATDLLTPAARPVTLGVIGCGAQAVTQVHAIARVRPVERVLALDTDATVAAGFARRIAFLDRPCEVIAPAEAAALLSEVDVLCTCTSVDAGAGPVVTDAAHRPWLHVNAVGADFPGKRELPQSLLEQAVVCPDLEPQCRAEGEAQWLGGAPLGPDLPALVQGGHRHDGLRDRLTVFDSTGWALEDLVVAELFDELAAACGIGHHLELQHLGHDPHDPYAGVRP